MEALEKFQKWLEEQINQYENAAKKSRAIGDNEHLQAAIIADYLVQKYNTVLIKLLEFKLEQLMRCN